VNKIIYFLGLPDRVDVPVSEPVVSLPEVVLGVDTWVADEGDDGSKLYLKREECEGVEMTAPREMKCRLGRGTLFEAFTGNRQ
jgi:hypothetical protein